MYIYMCIYIYISKKNKPASVDSIHVVFFFIRFVDHASLYNLVNKANLVHNFIPPCIPDSHPHRVTNSKCRIDTVTSPDDGYIVARNV